MGKPAIAWGVFRAVGLPQFSDDERLHKSGYICMKVTSFRTLRRGTVMAYGQDLDSGESTSRKTDGMFFYQTEQAMRESIAKAQKLEPALVKKVRAALALSSDAQREYRVAMESELNKRAIQPVELSQ